MCHRASVFTMAVRKMIIIEQLYLNKKKSVTKISSKIHGTENCVGLLVWNTNISQHNGEFNT